MSQEVVVVSVNGEDRSVNVPSEMPLLWVLRDVLDLTGTKYGCGIGVCGSCTVHVDGAPVRACVTAVREVARRSVTTIEGLSADGQHAVQRAWAEGGVPQCGYCQPGQIMSAAALLERTPAPTDDEIVTAMSGNLCRCGTYRRILAALQAVSQRENE